MDDKLPSHVLQISTAANDMHKQTD